MTTEIVELWDNNFQLPDYYIQYKYEIFMN